MGNFTGFQKSEDYYQHPKLGLIKRIQTNNGPQLIEHKVIVESQDAVEAWKGQLQKLEQFDLSEVLFLPHSHYFQKIGYCGRNGEVFMLFDDYMFSLKDEIQNRRKICRSFPESTVIQILYRLAKAERDLQKLNLKLGQVNSASIMVNQDGDWRIISQYSCPHPNFTPISGYDQFTQFLSPEEWQNKKKVDTSINKKFFNQTSINEVKMQRNSNISQTFSIGMIILEICTLEPSQQVYRNGFNVSMLQERIKVVQDKFSFAFVNILKGMLNLAPNQRMRSQEIVKILEPYEKLILSHKQISFQFNPIAAANVQTTNNSTRDESDNSPKQNRDLNKWQRLVNFLPFRQQQINKNKKARQRIIYKSSSCFGQRKSVTVAGAH